MYGRDKGPRQFGWYVGLFMVIFSLVVLSALACLIVSMDEETYVESER